LFCLSLKELVGGSTPLLVQGFTTPDEQNRMPAFERRTVRKQGTSGDVRKQALAADI
jgi:hypothetical protein